MDAANEILSVYAAKDIEIEAGNHLGIQTEMFTLADNAISIEAGDGIVVGQGHRRSRRLPGSDPVTTSSSTEVAMVNGMILGLSSTTTQRHAPRQG